MNLICRQLLSVIKHIYSFVEQQCFLPEGVWGYSCANAAMQINFRVVFSQRKCISQLHRWIYWCLIFTILIKSKI